MISCNTSRFSVSQTSALKTQTKKPDSGF